MAKYLLVTLALSGLFISCGQKSQITPAVKAETTAEANGDGTHIIRTVVMPLSDNMISDYESPISRINFIVGGFARMFMDLGASMGLGRSQLTMFQPVPEIPREFIKSVTLKRVFFYIEPVKGERKKKFWERFLGGRSNVDFHFLDKIAVKISPHTVENVRRWNPHFETRDIRAGEYTPLQSLFEGEDVYAPIPYPETLKELVIVKYSSKDRQKFVRNSDFGSIFIMNSDHPIKTKRFLEEHPSFKGHFKRIHVLPGKKLPNGQLTSGTLLVELMRDPIIEEGFKIILSEEAEALEKTGLDVLEECTDLTCLDFKLPEVDILPLVSRGNAIKIDAFIDAKKVPESFQLKGFIEFEVKIKLSF